jgi:hypothetical protein
MVSEEEQQGIRDGLRALLDLEANGESSAGPRGTGLFEAINTLWRSHPNLLINKQPSMMIAFLRELGTYIPTYIMVYDQASGSRQKYVDIFHRDVSNIERRTSGMPAGKAAEQIAQFFYDKLLYGEGNGVVRI